MKYICLRDCFVASRLWRQGEVYDLPDDMNKNEKNFRLLNAPEPLPELIIEPEPTPESIPELPEVIIEPVIEAEVIPKPKRKTRKKK